MPAYDNRSLFSDHYLEQRLVDHEAWRAADDPAVRAAYQRATEIYRAAEDVLPRMNEAQTRDELIQPLLADVLSVRPPDATGWALIAAGAATAWLIGQAYIALRGHRSDA